MSNAQPAPKVAPQTTQTASAKMLQLRLESKPVIYSSYMSFLEHGGVFLPSTDKFNMGEEILLVLELAGAAKMEKLFIKTHVCWINQSPSAGGRPRGVGLAFGDDESGLKAKAIFEAILSGLLHNERPTYTL